MENDLIRRGDALTVFAESTSAMPEKQWRRRIEEIPAVDAEPVVRCKDCRKNPKISMVGCPMAGLKTWKEYGFCFMGE